MKELQDFLFFVLALNTAATAGYLALRIARSRASAAAQLRSHLTVFCAAAIFALVAPRRPIEAFRFEPVVKIWAAPSAKSLSESQVGQDAGTAYLGLRGFSAPWTRGFDASGAGLIVAALVALGVLAGAARFAIDVRALRRLRRDSLEWKRRGRVRILIHPTIASAFSHWNFFGAWIYLPQHLLEEPGRLRYHALHEIQHHRNGDTIWVYPWIVGRLLMFWNPVFHFWSRWIAELQEIACDRSLVDQRKVDREQYTRCLVEAASYVLRGNSRLPAGALGTLGFLERHSLKRRIQSMYEIQKRKSHWSRNLAGTGLALALAASGAVAAKQWVRDQRVDMNEAREMLEKARSRSKSDFPIPLNEKVLHQLNRYLGTPEGREIIEGALERMKSYRPTLDRALGQYQMPVELLAIPVVESRYRNLPDPHQQGWGAGIWMFIKSTARHYGLRVDENVDERLDERLESDAAMRYLKAEYLVFRDWQLAILAYNIGGNRVQEAIEKTGSRDAWKLIDAGFEGDTNYLAKVMAAVLILGSR